MPATSSQPAVSCSSLTKDYGSGDSLVRALRGVDLDIFPGELTLLVGPSGCGKTTLLSVVAGILEPSAGKVQVLGADLTRMSSWRKVRFRCDNIGFVFQQYNLLPALTAAENVTIPLLLAGWSKRKALRAAGEILERMGMSKRANALPTKLSGGQQQRVAIARAVVANPKLILADEPTGNLDSRNGAEVMNLLTELNREGTTIVMVTHSQHDAGYANRVINLFDGKVVPEVVL